MKRSPGKQKNRRSRVGLRNSTKAESFRLFKQGKGVADIAKERNLTSQTIEDHLAHYVANGDIHIGDLVAPEKIAMIEPHIKDYTEGPITPIKEKLGPAIGFGEIRLVIAWQHYQNTNQLK